VHAPPAEGSSAQQKAVKEAFMHAWQGYSSRAFGQDEVKPISGSSHNWIGLGLTIVDSLGTNNNSCLSIHVSAGSAAFRCVSD
jgi:hypothetical protein